MLLDLLGKKSMSLHIGIFMNDLAIETSILTHAIISRRIN